MLIFQDFSGKNISGTSARFENIVESTGTYKFRRKKNQSRLLQQ